MRRPNIYIFHWTNHNFLNFPVSRNFYEQIVTFLSLSGSQTNNFHKIFIFSPWRPDPDIFFTGQIFFFFYFPVSRNIDENISTWQPTQYFSWFSFSLPAGADPIYIFYWTNLLSMDNFLGARCSAGCYNRLLLPFEISCLLNSSFYCNFRILQDLIISTVRCSILHPTRRSIHPIPSPIHL